MQQPKYFCLKEDVPDDTNVHNILTTLINSGVEKWNVKLYCRITTHSTMYLMVFAVWDEDLAIQIKLAHADEVTERDAKFVEVFSLLTEDQLQKLLLDYPTLYRPLDCTKFNVLLNTMKDIVP